MSKPKIVTVVASLFLACGAVSAQQFWSHRIGIEVDVPYGDDPN